MRCGADILLNGLRFDIEGEGRCVVCGSATHVKMKGGKLLEIEPQTAVLHVVEMPVEQGRIGIVCEASPLFDKEPCLRRWLKEYHGKPGTIFKSQEFLDQMLHTGPDIKPVGPA